MRRLAPDFWASPQVGPQDLEAAAREGVSRVVNNRPDGEEPGQPEGAQVEAWARAAGLEYVALPIRGMPDDEAVRRTAELLADGRPTLAYCRSGLRSAAAWAMAVRRGGELEPDEIRAAARQAGYDLSGLPL